MRQMKDSTNPGAIPPSTALVAGYVPPSRFAWSAAAWGRFNASIHVSITPSATRFGPGIHVLDVEPGDATAAQVPGWVLASRGNGQEPTVYTAYGNWAAVIQACINAGVPVPQFWIAEWDGIQTLPTITVHGVTYTAVAKQYADPAHGSGGDWDSSVVADHWPGVDTGADTMNWTDNLTNPHDATQVEQAGDLLWEIDLWAARNGAALAGLTAAVAASTSNPAITADALKQMIDDAVAQHVQITGTVTVTGVAGTTQPGQ